MAGKKGEFSLPGISAGVLTCRLIGSNHPSLNTTLLFPDYIQPNTHGLMGAPFQPIRPGQYHLPTVRAMTSTEVKVTSTRCVCTYRLDLGVSHGGDVDGVEADVGLVHEKREHHVHPEEHHHCQNGKRMRRTWQPARLQADGPAQRLPVAAPTMMACTQVPVRVATIRATTHWPNGRGMCLGGERKKKRRRVTTLGGTKQCTTQAKTLRRPTNFRLALPLYSSYISSIMFPSSQETPLPRRRRVHACREAAHWMHIPFRSHFPMCYDRLRRTEQRGGCASTRTCCTTTITI